MKPAKLLKTLTFSLIVVLLVIPFGAAGAAGPFTDSWEEPVDAIIYNPCTDEWVWLTGTIHILYHDNLTPSGELQWETRTSYNKVRGMGLTSGDTYVGVGVSQGGGGTIQFPDQAPYHYHAFSQHTMSLIGKGGLADYKVFMNFHLAVTPDFEWHAYFENFRLACS